MGDKRMNATEGFDMATACMPVAERSLMAMAAMEGAGHILRYINPAFCRLAGKTREELMGTPFLGSVTSGGDCMALLDRVYETGVGEKHTEAEDPESTPFCWAYSSWPFVSQDESRIGVILQVTETTTFHRIAAAMNQALLMGSVHQHELTAAAEKLNTELGRANQDLKQFAFAASHDLQEPLRMITTYSQLLVRNLPERLDGEAAVCVDFIAKGTRQMRELLGDLLAYTEAGQKKDEANDAVDLNQTIDKVRRNLEMALNETGAVLTCAVLPVVRGNAARYVQLFQNLIGNALKYRSALRPRIDISVEQSNGEFRFAVADNGMGIAEEYHQTIFGVFKRLHGPEIPGTGIGLAICQRVVDRYGGRIWLESQAGQGTTFYFTLPVGVEVK